MDTIISIFYPLLLILLSATSSAISSSEECPSSSPATAPSRLQRPDYLIVGAGGSGIQTALLLRKHSHTYRIFDKSSSAGSFWTRFPVFRELISVNKRARNETQRFRYDWHSFLESECGMRNVSTAYYPTGREWHSYMNLVVEESGIDVEYGMEVASIDEGTEEPCVTFRDGSRESAPSTECS